MSLRDISLNDVERLLLINQYEIRKKLEPGDANYFDRCIEILRRGYKSKYSELFCHLYEPLDETASRFVLDVLKLYRLIEHYKAEHPTEDDILNGPYAYFHGFDGNTESHLYGFARFLLDEQDTFMEQKPYRTKTDTFNSHMPIETVYRGMLARWDELGNPNRLTREQVLKILPMPGE